MASILTNAGAFTALRVLEQTNRSLGTTQDRIATGLKVATAKDNASFWAVSATMKSDVAAFKSITDNLSLATNAASVARDGAQQISELVKEIKSKATSAQEGALDKSKMQADIDNALKQIDEIVAGAQFNGVNLLAESKEMRYLSSIVRGDGVDPSYITFDTANLSRDGGGGLAMLDGLSVLGRGDSIYKSSTNGSATYVFDLEKAADGAADNDVDLTVNGLQSGATIKFSYKDQNGVARTAEFATKEALTATGRDLSEAFKRQLEANSQVRDNFTIEIGSSNEIKVTAKDRDSGVEFTSIEIDGNDATAGTAFNGTAVAANTLKQTMTMEFNDEPLRIGEEFNFNFQAASQNYEIVMRVADGDKTSGDLIDASGNRIVVALDSREVAEAFTSGEKIAAEVVKALKKATGSDGAGGDESDAANNYTQTGALTADQVAAANALRVSLGAAASNAFAGTEEFIFSQSATVGEEHKLTVTLLDSAAAANGLHTNTHLLRSFDAPKTDYAAILKNVEAAQEVALNAAASLGSAQKRIEIQQDFLKGMVDNLNVGIGTLVDANMNEESARLQALQVQQQLGIQALSIANQSPQSLLSLFR